MRSLTSTAKPETRKIHHLATAGPDQKGTGECCCDLGTQHWKTTNSYWLKTTLEAEVSVNNNWLSVMWGHRMGTRTRLWSDQPRTGCGTWSQTLPSLNGTLLPCDMKTPNLILQPYCKTTGLTYTDCLPQRQHRINIKEAVVLILVNFMNVPKTWCCIPNILNNTENSFTQMWACKIPPVRKWHIPLPISLINLPVYLLFIHTCMCVCAFTYEFEHTMHIFIYTHICRYLHRQSALRFIQMHKHHVLLILIQIRMAINHSLNVKVPTTMS